MLRNINIGQYKSTLKDEVIPFSEKKEGCRIEDDKVSYKSDCRSNVTGFDDDLSKLSARLRTSLAVIAMVRIIKIEHTFANNCEVTRDLNYVPLVRFYCIQPVVKEVVEIVGPPYYNYIHAT